MNKKKNFQSFEDIKAWQLSRELSIKVYGLTKSSDMMSKDYGFKDQIRRASISVMNNVAEGYERASTKEFTHFLYISRGSVGEVRSMLYVAKDLEYITEEEFNEIHTLSTRIAKVIWGLIRSIKNRSEETSSTLN